MTSIINNTILNKIIKFVESGMVVVGVLFFTGGLQPATSDTINSLVRYGVFFGAILAMMPHFKKAIYVATLDKFLLALMGLALASFLWSPAPDFTTGRCVDLLRATTMGLYIAVRFSLREQLRLIAYGMGLTALLCFYYAVAVPSIGVDNVVHIGAWRGVLGSKNVMGGMMGVSTLAFYLCLIDQKNTKLEKILFFSGLALSILLVLQSTSKSALVFNIFILGFVYIYQRYRWKGVRSVVTLCLYTLVLGFIGLVVLTNWNSLLTALGRDPTLTGRTHIWAGSIEALMEHSPLLGFGMGGFWRVMEYVMPISRRITFSIDFVVPHSHNGFLEVALDVGLVGLFLFLGSWLVGYVRALKLGYQWRTAASMWPAAILTYIFIVNITESYLMRLGTIFWVLYVAASLAVRNVKVMEPTTTRLAERPNSLAQADAIPGQTLTPTS